jgi:septum formation protein
MKSVVLASTSPYRLQLLRQLGIPFQVAQPLFEEQIDQQVAPGLLVKHLAAHKARSLAERYPEALIIGADQVFADPRGRIHGKPGTFEKALKQLKEMAGKSHTFFTGISVFDSGSGEGLTDFATYSVTLRRLSEDQIRTYLRREEPFDCAGSFKVEGLGITLIERMEGDDYTTLIGLPLIKTVDYLNYFGITVLGSAV